MAPISYLSTNNGRQEANCEFDVKGNIVRFKFRTQPDKNATLVIDPQLVFQRSAEVSQITGVIPLLMIIQAIFI